MGVEHYYQFGLGKPEKPDVPHVPPLSQSPQVIIVDIYGIQVGGTFSTLGEAATARRVLLEQATGNPTVLVKAATTRLEYFHE